MPQTPATFPPPGTNAPPPPCAETDVALPASFAQERQWFLAQYDSGSPLYHVPLAYDIAGPLKMEALRESLLDVVRRHESLRTNFIFENGALLQVIHENATCPFALLDLSDIPDPQREVRAADEAGEFIRRPFDLSTEPLLRVLILVLGAQTHRLVLNIHHIIFDGVSLGIFFRDLSEFYRARLDRHLPSLKPLAIQYGDFAAWQRQSMQGASLERGLTFWKQRLSDLPAPLDLPTDSTTEFRPTSAGGDFFFALPADLASAARAFCRRENVTLFMLLTICFQSLLFRYTGQERLLTGAPVANRSRTETEDLIGLFVNSVALRADFSEDPSVRELLLRTREEILGAVAHGDLPFEKLVNELRVERNAGRNPLFRTMLVLQDHTVPASLPGVNLRPRPVAVGAATLDLLIEMIDDGTGIRGGIGYNAGLFAQPGIERLAGHFTTLLRGMVESPESKITSLPMLTATEQEQLSGWKRTARDFPATQTVAALFEQCAARVPDAVALRDGDDQLDYATLNRHANAVAIHLQTRGVGPGSLVGVPAERSFRFIIATLGILKAGGAYVPLDSTEPAERARIMRSHCAHVISWDAMPRGDADFVSAHSDSTAPACVLFTSGSTGVPKGVVVPHRAITRLVMNNDFAPFSPDDSVAFASNVCFDAATFEIWGALLNGGTLVVVQRETLLSPAALATFLDERRVTTLFLTTSLFNRMAAENPAMFAKLKCLVFGGEPADAHSVRQVLAHGKPHRLVNGYGPTETATFAVCHNIERIEGGHIPIGRPIANTRAHVLDRALNEVPVGVSGELHIGGPGVALGYINDPVQTAARFIETKFGRLYKTGDLAKWRADGTLDCHGRMDSQIKLRGFRIEPGEIETALQKHPGVRQAAVVAQSVPGGDRALVAYVVASAEKRPDAAALREFLSASLPSHMIPQGFVWLDTMPLTPNGKLDQRMLPLPPPEPSAPKSESLRPRDPIERGVSEVWAQVFGRNGFSRHDDFFAMGGHSLLALRVLADIRKKFGVDVPARRLFETPTIEGLAQFVSGHLSTAEEFRSLVPVQRGESSRPPLFLVPGGWGGEIEFLVYAELSRHLDPAQPIWGLKARGAGTADAPHATVTEMAADYLREIRAMQPHGPYLIAGECVGGICAHEMACQLEDSGERVALLMLFDTTVPAPSFADEYIRAESRKRETEECNTGVNRRIRHHLDKMSGLSLGEKFGYLLKKATGRTCTQAPSVGQHPRGQKDYPVTLMRHQPRAYRGKVTLFLDEESSRLYGKLGWEKASIGGLETHILPGDHITYIREHAQTAAAKIREILAAAGSALHT